MPATAYIANSNVNFDVPAVCGFAHLREIIAGVKGLYSRDSTVCHPCVFFCLLLALLSSTHADTYSAMTFEIVGSPNPDRFTYKIKSIYDRWSKGEFEYVASFFMLCNFHIISLK